MKTNIRYMGFGFPIVLVGVEAVKSEDGSSFLDIPHQKLARGLFLAVLANLKMFLKISSRQVLRRKKK